MRHSLTRRSNPIDLSSLWAAIRGWTADDETWPRRLAVHLTILLLVGLTIGLSHLSLTEETAGIRPIKQVSAEPGRGAITTRKIPPLTLPDRLNPAPNDWLARAAMPYTIVPDRTKAEISTYAVQSGDTIYGIAARFGLSPDTIMWSNSELENSPDMLRVGQEITILPFDGVYHQVGGGDTIEKIASTYKADPQAIIDSPLNELDPDNPIIQPGQWVVVPGGSKPFQPRTVTAYSGSAPANALIGTGSFRWPATGVLYQGYWSAHPAIDIAYVVGAPILAADNGYVVIAGWDNLYGYYIVLDHSNGFQTLYAHLDEYYVTAGENVSQGQQIGTMGSTGNSTGPHLHFEIRQGTVQRNPIGFLP